jgi:integrase
MKGTKMSRIDTTSWKPSTRYAKGSEAFPTVAAAIVMIDAATDLSDTEKRHWKSPLRAIARIYGRPIETIRLDPAELGPRLRTASAAAWGFKLTSTTPAVYRNAIASALRWMGILDQPKRSQEPLAPEWATLRAGLTDKYLSIGLQAFMAYCDAARIAPEAVTGDTLLAYLGHLRRTKLKEEPSVQVRKIARRWNQAITLVPGWPQAPLAVPTFRNDYGRPLTSYPESYQREFNAYLGYLAGTVESPADGEYRHEQARLDTIADRTAQLRIAAAALVETGDDPATITSLAVLLEVPNLKRILDVHWQRAGRKATDHTGGISDALRGVARFLIPEGDPRLPVIVKLLQKAKPKKRTRMTAKNEHILARFDDPVKLSLILHLPEKLMRDADEMRMSGNASEAAWLAGVAVAVSIELCCPMRCHNLTRLRMGHDLVRFDGRRKLWSHFMIERDEMKSEEPLRWPVAPDTSALIDHYLEIHRPTLTHASAPWLFPGRDRADEPCAKTGFSQAIAVAIHRLVGVPMHLHGFRALAGKLILDEDGGSIENLRLLLGHTTLVTALRYCRSCAPASAARRVHAIFDKRKAQTKLLAQAQYGRLGTPGRMLTAMKAGKRLRR